MLQSVAYIGPDSRTERPTKTKIGTEVAHVTRDSDTTFKVKRSKVKVTGDEGILWRPPARLVIVISHSGEGYAITIVCVCVLFGQVLVAFNIS